jgi:hypothetical protein
MRPDSKPWKRSTHGYQLPIPCSRGVRVWLGLGGVVNNRQSLFAWNPAISGMDSVLLEIMD